MIFYLSVIIGTAISSCFVGQLGFEFDDPFEPVEMRVFI
jgi:hypothetical protein